MENCHIKVKKVHSISFPYIKFLLERTDYSLFGFYFEISKDDSSTKNPQIWAKFCQCKIQVIQRHVPFHPVNLMPSLFEIF